ncbi:unnamed protein product [Psylliodes chrysocephalus]|uniref:F-box domain-containing protein n=1 Tax=Psylliodes chrysocephalus TaxID=3402493 RepID=A0A9P0CP46_9CUCU|nr:unnamed protein product [Psylliodes chrysocephala]
MGDKVFCIKTVKKRPIVDPEIPCTENFDLFEALESVYPLLDIILDYLDCDDLRSCCEVKNAWKEVAERILCKRIQPSWFTCFKAVPRNKLNIYEHSDNLNFNNVGIGIILYDFRRIKLNKYICIHNDDDVVSHGAKSKWNSVPEYFEKELVPRNTDYCIISCPKVISHFHKNSKNLCKASFFDGLFIPKIPKIRTAMFHCNPVRKNEIRSTVESNIHSHEEIRCLLMFSTTDQKKALYNLLKELIPENDASSVAVGGGIIRGTKTFLQVNPAKSINSSNDIFSIVFLKEKGAEADFNAFSYVIFGDDLSKEEFADEIFKFKGSTFLRTHSVVIRVCCSAKVDADEEPKIFNKIFPGIPIFGFHADGEIGWNCVLTPSTTEDVEECQAKKAKHKYPNVRHQWSTVFVLITWGAILS